MPTLSTTLQLIRSDVRARLRYENRGDGLLPFLSVLTAPATMGVNIGRFAHYLQDTPLRPLNKLLKLLNLTLFAIEIEPEAIIGEGFIVLNPCGVMIHGHTEIGKNNIWDHQITTTLGPRIGFDPINDYIRIGDEVVVNAGVRIVGNLHIASGAWIAPNRVITESVTEENARQTKEATP